MTAILSRPQCVKINSKWQGLRIFLHNPFCVQHMPGIAINVPVYNTEEGDQTNLCLPLQPEPLNGHHCDCFLGINKLCQRGDNLVLFDSRPVSELGGIHIPFIAACPKYYSHLCPSTGNMNSIDLCCCTMLPQVVFIVFIDILYGVIAISCSPCFSMMH